MNAFSRGLRISLVGVVFAATVYVAYQKSFSVPFLLDDETAVVGNASIRHVFPLLRVLQPPAGAGVGGRPFLNLSFALSNRFGDGSPWSFHVVNFGIHLVSGLLLFCVVRSTLLLPLLRSRYGNHSFSLAATCALLWTLHPVNTSSVTYVSQRAESLMGMFYLLTLYSAIRAMVGSAKGWTPVAWIACLLGMGTKEVMVTAPIAVLLYDRIFIKDSIRDVLRSRWPLYAGLAGAWLLLGYLMVDINMRQVGFGVGVKWWHYAATECRVVINYLGLSFWPSPLVFDYGPNAFVTSPGEFAVFAAALALLLGVIAYISFRSKLAGYGGLCFILILAPTSSIVPVALQPMAENRLYLPSAAVIVMLVITLYRFLGRTIFPIMGVLIVVFGWLTWQRNKVYKSELTLWRDTVVKRPDSSRAHTNLGMALAHAGRLVDAVDVYRTALRLEPGNVDAHNDLGAALLDLSQLGPAMLEFHEALRLRPGHAASHYNLANALLRSGRPEEALAHAREAIRIRADYAEAMVSAGAALSMLGRDIEALPFHRSALALQPNNLDARINLGVALTRTGDPDSAVREFTKALELQPNSALAHNGLGNALAAQGQNSRAIEEFKEALRIDGTYLNARKNLEKLGGEVPIPRVGSGGEN